MRIIIDMQGAQTESRYRGIGRYSLSLAQAIARNSGPHDVVLALSGLFPDTIDPIREAFRNLLPAANIRVWYAPGPTRELAPDNASRRRVAERVREAFIESLDGDVVLITSLFEGLGDDAVISVGEFDRRTPAATIVYDLIPLLSPDIHFRTSPLHQGFYAQRLRYLKRSRLLLAISESARQECLGALPFGEEDVVNVSGGYDTTFVPLDVPARQRQALESRVGITRPFVMYTGGADERKNLARLIQAYAGLPATIRQSHQLVLAGRMPSGEVNALADVAARSGLRPNELIFTGYVSDEELRALYSLCRLFVFPSTHEGFGLPPLEAMASGVPVVTSNATSLPEVTGWNEAMFDPLSVEAIQNKLQQALSDEAFRAALLENGKRRLTHFSWDRSARLAIAALERFDPGAARTTSPIHFEQTALFTAPPKRILLLKLDHIGDLLLAVPAIAKLRARYPSASIEIVVGRWNLELARTLPYFSKIHTLDYFKTKSAARAELEPQDLAALRESLGIYDIAIDLRRQADTRFILGHVRARTRIGYKTFQPDVDRLLDILLEAATDEPYRATWMNRTSISLQMLALVDAVPPEPSDYLQLAPSAAGHGGRRAGIALFPYAGNDVKEWAIDRFHELARRLVRTAATDTVHVFFASEAEAARHRFDTEPGILVHAGLPMPGLIEAVSHCALCIANNSGGAHLASHLGLPVVGIYGGHERSEEWAPIHPHSYVIHRAAHCSPCHIASRADCQYGMFCLDDISVDEVEQCVLSALAASRAAESGKNHPAQPRLPRQTRDVGTIKAELLDTLPAMLNGTTDAELETLSRCIAASLPAPRQRSLFIDVSELVRHDARTGIQRVTRAVLSEMLAAPPKNFEVVPIYAKPGATGYLHAESLSCRAHALGAGSDEVREDLPIEFGAGDVFLGLDLLPSIVPDQKDFLAQMHRDGVRIVFVVYDLLPVLLPHCFNEGTSPLFERWLNTIVDFDGVLCGSRAVADDFRRWVEQHRPDRLQQVDIDYFHLGADLENSQPTRGLPADAPQTIEALRARPSFLIVGTIEPRKGHAQALDAFELLWSQGLELNLVIVGKAGWMVDTLVTRLRNHPQLGQHLFWLEGISDEYLEHIYGACTCLLAASQGEGFGLPLIEAARHGLPIIARDLPVFVEVAGRYAQYFSGLDSASLAKTIAEWLTLHAKGEHPTSRGMPWLTWRETARDLLTQLLRPPVLERTGLSEKGPEAPETSSPMRAEVQN